MRHPIARLCAFSLPLLASTACAAPAPPTITPAPPTPGGSTVQEIQVPPRAGATLAAAVAVPSIEIAATTLYRDAEAKFSIEVPQGWPEARQAIDPSKGDVKLGTYFQPAQHNGLLSITQFDSGEAPQSLGVTINQVMAMSGVIDQPNYRELNREKVIEREDDALRVEISYSRSDGINMHSLVLFQIDGTIFSMVHLGVETSSWLANEGRIREILSSYRVPAVGG